MKKNIVIISMVLIGLILVFNGNSWAARLGGGPQQKWDNPPNADNNSDRGRSWAPGIQHDRSADRFTPQLHRRDHYRAPYRFAPKYRHWNHRPFYRPFHHKRYYWRPYHGAVINNYYGSAESYAPEDEFSASATVSDTGFSVSVAVRDTN